MSPLVSVLLPFAIKQGLPLLTNVLEGKIGAGNAALVEAVVKTVADKAGVTVESLPEVAAKSPAVLDEAVRRTEDITLEMMALYTGGLELQAQVLASEQAEPWWAWAWRPAAMWGFGVLWFWNLVVVHVLNYVLKAQFPPGDLWLLFQLNAVYMGLYMGGHTIKDAVAKVSERMGPK